MIVPKQSTRELLEKATSQYQDDLLGDQEAQEYLRGRGISKDLADYFRLGVVRNPLQGHEEFAGRLVFPYLTPTGVVTLRFRALGAEKSKYLSLKGDEVRIYNTQALLEGKEIFICEGETDTIAAHGFGLQAVGFPGANTWHKNARVFARVFANRTVSVLADNDDTGDGLEFAKDIVGTLGEGRIILMPKGHDVSSVFLTDPAWLGRVIRGVQ